MNNLKKLYIEYYECQNTNPVRASIIKKIIMTEEKKIQEASKQFYDELKVEEQVEIPKIPKVPEKSLNDRSFDRLTNEMLIKNKRNVCNEILDELLQK